MRLDPTLLAVTGRSFFKGGASSRAEPAGFLGELLHQDPLTPGLLMRHFLPLLHQLLAANNILPTAPPYPGLGESELGFLPIWVPQSNFAAWFLPLPRVSRKHLCPSWVGTLGAQKKLSPELPCQSLQWSWRQGFLGLLLSYTKRRWLQALAC